MQTVAVYSLTITPNVSQNQDELRLKQERTKD